MDKKDAMILEKKNIKDFYNSLTEDERLVFRQRVMDETFKQYPTVYSWFRGANKPGKLEQEIITAISNGIVSWD